LKESISTKVSSGKERFLHKTTRAERKHKIEENKAQKQCKNSEKDKTKQKKDDTRNGAARKGVGLVSNVRPAQSASGLPEVPSLDQAVLTDLQREVQTLIHCIGLIGSSIDELQTKLAGLMEKLHRQEQQCDVIRSLISTNRFASADKPSHHSVTITVCICLESIIFKMKNNANAFTAGGDIHQ
jgi:signal transduction protein with GAF and PtsI domain